ncbi:MAG: DegT/DnrJ/EryC1/StrS family aminotransferase [Acidobacteriaceae bacterium]|nr:DegT/DnrJ/EryC1/StrS family aminotransferase [Acidobacteriaceae bacterium]
MSGTIPCTRVGLAEDADSVHAAIARVVDSRWYVLGPEVEAFEAEFASASGARHAVGVGNGTDAIAIALRALGVGPGDEVITTPLSAAYTALAVRMLGAIPVFADIDAARFTIDPDKVERAITPKTRALLPVHLYGQAAEMTRLEAIASRYHLAMVEDCAQAHLATVDGQPAGTIGHAGTFSFYPTKNLGALGDGGAIVTNDSALAETMKRLRNGGQSTRYRHDVAGVNSRLDELQAAVLRARLPYLPAWTEARRRIASSYRERLAGSHLTLPAEIAPGHVYHLFVVQSSRRDALQAHLKAQGIETLIHYPFPIPEQPAFADTPSVACPATKAACQMILSLPMFPQLTDAAITRIADAVYSFEEA